MSDITQSGARRASQDPLGPFLGAGVRRARFSVRPEGPHELERVHGLLAGAAQRDITPPPGMPKAGYSSNAHDGTGFRTRLRARVVHLRAGRTSLAVVQCDLLGGSSVLQHLVAQRIADRTDIGIAGLMIGATHTHAGPGQFLGTDFYNRFASNRAGFDPRWTSFLVERISEAVIEAYETRAPARLAFGRTEVWGLTRNRSMDPHVHNETVLDDRMEPQRKYVSVNPHLDLLRVDRVAEHRTDPLAAMVVFSVHGTGISQHAHEYNADLWAYLVGELGDQIEEESGRRAVVGAIEGTHADVAPNLRPGQAGHLEAQRIGRGIGAEASELWRSLAGHLRDDVQLGAGLREVDLDLDRSIDGIELPDRAAVGAALVAGATENTTPVLHLIPPFKAGSPKSWGRSGPQGEKWVLGSRFMQPAILPRKGFPRVLPVQVLRIGPVRLVGLPFEVTTESGRRLVSAIDDAVGAAAGSRPDADTPEEADARVVVSSVANEYSGYVTTPEEYTRQFYEGGHTIYGPLTLAFLSAHAARLAERLLTAECVCEVMEERHWDSKVRQYLAQPVASSARRRVLGPAVFVDPSASDDGYWELRWRDVPPGNMHWHEPLVTVEANDLSVASQGKAIGADSRVWPDEDESGWFQAWHLGHRVDDQGWDLEVTHLGPADGDETGTVHEYRVRWFDPEHRAGRRHRFVLVENNGRPEVVSTPFD